MVPINSSNIIINIISTFDTFDTFDTISTINISSNSLKNIIANILLSHTYITFRARSRLRVGGARVSFAPSN